MHILLFIKRTFRSPVKLLISFLLLSFAMFALVLQVSEMDKTYDYVNKAKAIYMGVGFSEVQTSNNGGPSYPFYIDTDPRLNIDSRLDYKWYHNKQYEQLTAENIEFLKSIEGVDAYDLRYMTAGISNEYMRLDEGKDYYNYTNRMVVEATLTDLSTGGFAHGLQVNQLRLKDINVLAGNASFIGTSISVDAYGELVENKKTNYIHNGSRGVRLYDDQYTYDTSALEALMLNKRYIFVLRYDLNLLSNTFDDEYYLGDHLSDSWCEAIQEGKYSQDLLDTSQMSSLEKIIKITNRDLYTFDMVYTNNLKVVKRFVEKKMVVDQGRSITEEDSLEKKSVCVISRTFADYYKLDIGDTLDFDLGHDFFETYKGLGALAITPERFFDASYKVTLNIVGIYDDLDGVNDQINKPNWSFSINTVFLPVWLIESRGDINLPNKHTPNAFSFVVKDTENIELVKDYIESNHNELNGLNITFDDLGWLEIDEQFSTYKLITKILLVFIVLSYIVVVYFVVFMYVKQVKKTFAICVAIGTQKFIAIRNLFVPFILLAFVSFATGGTLAGITSKKYIKTTDFIDKMDVSFQVNQGTNEIIFLSILSGILLVLVFLGLSFKKLNSLSPLEMLQDRAVEKKQSFKVESTCTESKLDNINFGQEKRNNYNYIFKYILRHVYRRLFQSIILVCVVSILLMGIGQYFASYESSKTLYKDSEVIVKIKEGLTYHGLSDIEKKEYVENLYFEYTHFASDSTGLEDVIVSNNLMAYAGEDQRHLTDEPYDIGPDMTCFVSEEFLTKYNYKIGDEINLIVFTQLIEIENRLIKNYKMRFREESKSMTREEIIKLISDKIKEELDFKAVYYTISSTYKPIGSMSSTSILINRSEQLYSIFNQEIQFNYVEFKLADNFKIDEFDLYMKKIITGNAKYYLDTNKISSPKKTYETYKTLLPFVLLMPLLILSVISILMALNHKKEIAILRMLGSSVKALLFIFTTRYLALYFIGIASGIAMLQVMNKSVLENHSDKLLSLAALYGLFYGLALFITILMMSCSTPLDKLQAEE